MEYFQVLVDYWAGSFSIPTLRGTLPYSVFLNRLLSILNIVTYDSSLRSAPPGFPSSGNGLWYTAPGTIWTQEFLPIGNGYLGGM